jgi:hypothetical protein
MLEGAWKLKFKRFLKFEFGESAVILEKWRMAPRCLDLEY